MKLKTLLFSAFLLAALPLTPAFAAPASDAPDPLVQRLSEVSAEFRAEPGDFEVLFAPDFLKAVPPEQFKAVFSDLFAKLGPVTASTLLKRPSAQVAVYQLQFQKGFQAEVKVSIEAQAPYRLNGLFIGPPSPSADSLPALVDEFKKLPGKCSFTVSRLQEKGPETLASWNADESLALGSAFKLFILGTLADEMQSGKRRWSDTLQLKPELKSLPSGILQSWPDGSPLTLHSLAALMISFSDNTATDHLLSALGRERVEAMMGKMGVAHPERSFPLLRTREMFLLKGASKGDALPRYVAMGASERRSYLKNVVDRQDVRVAEPFWEAAGAPTAIDQVEWFASSRDMVSAMDWLRRHTEKGPSGEVRSILAINPGIKVDSKAWPYVGYKGGSEPGVLNMTYLLRARSGTWYAMAACWSNPQADVEDGRLAGLMSKVAEVLQEPSAVPSGK